MDRPYGDEGASVDRTRVASRATRREWVRARRARIAETGIRPSGLRFTDLCGRSGSRKKGRAASYCSGRPAGVRSVLTRREASYDIAARRAQSTFSAVRGAERARLQRALRRSLARAELDSDLLPSDTGSPPLLSPRLGRQRCPQSVQDRACTASFAGGAGERATIRPLESRTLPCDGCRRSGGSSNRPRS